MVNPSSTLSMSIKKVFAFCFYQPALSALYIFGHLLLQRILSSFIEDGSHIFRDCGTSKFVKFTVLLHRWIRRIFEKNRPVDIVHYMRNLELRIKRVDKKMSNC